jgi:hypothetical protein
VNAHLPSLGYRGLQPRVRPCRPFSPPVDPSRDRAPAPVAPTGHSRLRGTMISQDYRASSPQPRDLWSLKSLHAIYWQKRAFVRAFSSLQAEVYEWPLITEEKEARAMNNWRRESVPPHSSAQGDRGSICPGTRRPGATQADVLTRLPQVVSLDSVLLDDCPIRRQSLWSILLHQHLGL